MPHLMKYEYRVGAVSRAFIAEKESGNLPCGGHAFQTCYFIFVQFAPHDAKDVGAGYA